MIGVPSLPSLIDTEAKARTMLEGSCVEDDLDDVAVSLVVWERSRRYLVDALRPSGTLLDYGCANGFLLHCLLHWSGYALLPYGVDIDAVRLDQARRTFPGLEGHFGHPDHLGHVVDLPVAFDQVYWAVGDNVDFARPEHQRWLSKVRALTAPAGRFSMGFYDTPHANRAKLHGLAATGLIFDQVRWNRTGNGEAVGWLDR